MKKFISIFVVFFLPVTIVTAQKLPSPKEFFGFDIGQDYHLVNYTQFEKYFRELAKNSDRTILQDIGKTEEGRSMYMAIVSSPQNLKNIARYKEISQKLARAEISDTEAKQLEQEGKPVIWIDGGLHATETIPSQELIAFYYKLLSSNDEETLSILNNVIILLCEVNPDGLELTANWYMRNDDTLKRNLRLPKVYNKYIGHDNNRDFYMNNMKESENISRQLYVEWMPQIVYNHHQAGPDGSVLAGPPYRDPFNYVYDPLLVTGLDGVGTAMINRLNREGKPGYTRLGGSSFNTWWNGGLRTTPYFHNMIGILTEIIGSPTPSEIPFIPDRLIADNNTPFPVYPQKWHMKQSIDYSISLNYAVLDYAQMMGWRLLENIYVMGKNSITKGNENAWTIEPKEIEKVKEIFNEDVAKGIEKKPVSSFGQFKIPARYFNKVLMDSALRDPRGYVVPSDQVDFPTAVNFINALIKSGIKVYKASSSFQAGGKSYPAGSYVVKTDQAFRPHILDMFEPQNYRNDFQYPGGPPIRPYDAAGWTLAFQMGVKFDRILEGFDGPFDQIPYGEIQSPPVTRVKKSSKGYFLSSAVNNSFIAANDLLTAGVKVKRIHSATGDVPAGSFYIPADGFKILNDEATKWGVPVVPAASTPDGLETISPSKIALFDHYGGSIPSGWVRWLLEQFHFTYSVIYPQEIDKGDLNSKYDILLFIDDGIPAYRSQGQPETGMFGSSEPKPGEVPLQYESWLGKITTDKSIPQLKKFIENGGTVVTVGQNAGLAYYLNLPVKNALLTIDNTGKERPVANDKYYIPASVLQAEVNTEEPANWGMPHQTDIIFDNSPVFTILPGAANIKPLAWFGNGNLLRSGWAWGQNYIKDAVVAFEATLGKGKLYAFGPEITFRAQAHGTFKFLFNQLYNRK